MVEQEAPMINMVLAVNAFTLRDIKDGVIQDIVLFAFPSFSIDHISLPTTDCVLKRHNFQMKYTPHHLSVSLTE